MDESIPARAGGNEAALDIIERARKLVELGNISAVSVSLISTPTDMLSLFGGRAGLEIAAIAALELHKDDLKEMVRKRSHPPAERLDAPANYVFYNRLKMPLTWDFWALLLQSTMNMKREGVSGPLHVGWFPDPAEGIWLPMQIQSFNNLMRESLQLVGAVEDQQALENGRNMGEHENACSYAPIIQGFERGEPLPKVTAPDPALKAMREVLKTEFGQKPVTITLRESHQHPFRNSNLPEWCKLADWLEGQGEKVVFVRDTAKMDEGLAGYTTCKAASEHVLARCALYQEAKCNWFVSNGPSMLGAFLETPWFLVNKLTEQRKDFRANTANGWRIAAGLEDGGQWPWAKPNQRIIYELDKFEPMRDAWQEYMRPLPATIQPDARVA